MIVLTREQIEQLIDIPKSVLEIEEAYRATSAGRVNLPPVGHITFPELEADCHIKYGHALGSPIFVIKIATGFPKNVDTEYPTGSGVNVVMSAQTGQVEAVLYDEGMLTDVRTGLGGAIATRLLARRDSKRVLIIGTGRQARYQIESHVAVMGPNLQFQVWGRLSERADSVVNEMSKICSIERVDDLESSVRDADIIVTITGSTTPLVLSDWVKPGTHITAVGADAPGKQELEVALVEKADVLVADHIEQCVDHGEISRFVQTDDTRKSTIVELGQVLNNAKLGRRNDSQITIADQTGIAACDIAISQSVLNSWTKNLNKT